MPDQTKTTQNEDALGFNFDKLLAGAVEMVQVHTENRPAPRTMRYKGHILIEVLEHGESVWTLQEGARDFMDKIRDRKPNDVGQFLKSLRASLRQTQQGLAELANLPLKTIQNWEQGQREPDEAGRRVLTMMARYPEVMLDVQDEDLVPA